MAFWLYRCTIYIIQNLLHDQLLNALKISSVSVQHAGNFQQESTMDTVHSWPSHWLSYEVPTMERNPLSSLPWLIQVVLACWTLSSLFSSGMNRSEKSIRIWYSQFIRLALRNSLQQTSSSNGKPLTTLLLLWIWYAKSIMQKIISHQDSPVDHTIRQPMARRNVFERDAWEAWEEALFHIVTFYNLYHSPCSCSAQKS